MRNLLLGYDIGSSSVKAALVDAGSRETLAVVQSPADAMHIDSPHWGWAEQDPEVWWKHVCIATKELLRKTSIDPSAIKGIGIAYQMHGLVCVDESHNPVRPAIIWCDSRAVHIGNTAFDVIGHEKCLAHLLNAPANFTASKLRWVKEHEPEVYERIHKVMLPGDYIAMKLTGEIRTTPAGLSEGMLWDFPKHDLADFVLDQYVIDESLIADTVPSFSIQGNVHAEAAKESGLITGIPVTYRAGDQPNNAMTLGALNPGEVAASGGTSGVVYGVTDKLLHDAHGRINSFMHVNHTPAAPRIGVLLCINGAGSQYHWTRHRIAHDETSFAQMETEAQQIPVGSDHLITLPFGNGAERMFDNREIGASLKNLDFNRHTRAHLYRSSLEGIACAFVYGIRLMQAMGVDVRVIRVGNDNLFQSQIFSSTIATLVGCKIDVIKSTGAAGAAKAAGVATGFYAGIEKAFEDISVSKSFTPMHDSAQYETLYTEWLNHLNQIL